MQYTFYEEEFMMHCKAGIILSVPLLWVANGEDKNYLFIYSNKKKSIITMILFSVALYRGLVIFTDQERAYHFENPVADQESIQYFNISISIIIIIISKLLKTFPAKKIIIVSCLNPPTPVVSRPFST